jgi:hypothetical protein
MSNGGGGTATIKNVILAGNTAPTSPDVSGVLNSQGHNLIGDGTGGSGYVDTDLVGTSESPIDPRLGPLQNNGGPTLTMALLPGSPAIDAGDNTDAPPWDQRGPGFPRITPDDPIIDIGAFEVQAGSIAQVQSEAAAAEGYYRDFQTPPPGYALLGEGPANVGDHGSPSVGTSTEDVFRLAPVVFQHPPTAPSQSPTFSTRSDRPLYGRAVDRDHGQLGKALPGRAACRSDSGIGRGESIGFGSVGWTRAVKALRSLGILSYRWPFRQITSSRGTSLPKTTSVHCNVDYFLPVRSERRMRSSWRRIKSAPCLQIASNLRSSELSPFSSLSGAWPRTGPSTASMISSSDTELAGRASR